MSEITQEEACDALNTTQKGFSGFGWDGFWLLGDSKSIKEVVRLQDCEARMTALEREIKEQRRQIANLQSVGHQP